MVLYDGMDGVLHQLHVGRGMIGDMGGAFRTSGESFRDAFSGLGSL